LSDCKLVTGKREFTFPNCVELDSSSNGAPLELYYGFTDASKAKVTFGMRGDTSGYFAVGFGAEMIGSRAAVTIVDGSGKVSLDEYALGGYSSGDVLPGEDELQLDMLGRGKEDGLTTVIFTRKTKVDNLPAIEAGSPSDIIWAFGDIPEQSGDVTFLAQHKNRGLTQISFSEDVVTKQVLGGGGGTPTPTVASTPVPTPPSETSDTPTPTAGPTDEPTGEETDEPTPEPSGSPRAEPTESPSEEGGGGVCFPGGAMIALANGESIPMRDLELGNQVLTANGASGEVYFFSHRRTEGLFHFVEVWAGNRSVTLSQSHYLPTARGLVPAGSVRLGDIVTHFSEGHLTVDAVRRTVATGLYAPHASDSAELWVDGFRVSEYTTAIRPSVAAVLLAPVKALYRMGAGAVLGDVYHATESVRGFLLGYPSIASIKA